MSEQSVRRLKIGFHIFIILFAIGVIVSSVLVYEEMERAMMYIVLGVIIGISSLFQVFRNVTKQPLIKL
ncbi:hypothetical protein PQ478_10445 [Alkalihalophilus pseudofirmus]|uniref:hypothetical protein n=1 Tax=Alkalihalophilus pseudofirmus TaxID=79885 RepID=UPI00259BA70E|nr:hypothetical protein [Alkalihalophilus pseudofirmus]WEG18880.1 hypothetical protein PQ478_10445 [Alkalihalophilus pseudofirmus]